MSYTLDTTTYRSPNFNARPIGMPIDSIVIHTTEGRWPTDAQWLCNPDAGVSAHYVLAPTGTIIYQLVSDAKRAWHAGESTYQGRSDWNDFSLGVEASHIHGQPWPAGQRDTLASLCRDLIARYHIPQQNIVAHRWVAPDRRSDPTDWPDADFKAWIAGLYAPAYRPYTVTSPCAVLTARAGDAPPAGGPDNGQTWLSAGDVINGEPHAQAGWLWVSDSPTTVPGIGFIPSSYARPV